MKLRQLVVIMTASSIALVLSGCNLVDRNKISGLQELAIWQVRSESLAKALGASGCEQSYNKARTAVNDHIDANLPSYIDAVAISSFGSVDLRKEHILPSGVTSAVVAFQNCAGPTPHTVFRKDDIPWLGEDEEEAAKKILEWVGEVIKEARKAEADQLKELLQTYKWKDWKSVHGSG